MLGLTYTSLFFFFFLIQKAIFFLSTLGNLFFNFLLLAPCLAFQLWTVSPLVQLFTFIIYKIFMTLVWKYDITAFLDESFEESLKSS